VKIPSTLIDRIDRFSPVRKPEVLLKHVLQYFQVVITLSHFIGTPIAPPLIMFDFELNIGTRRAFSVEWNRLSVVPSQPA
jgi:hypothetical protein